MRNDKVEIIPEINSGDKIIPSKVGFTPDNEKCIEKTASELIIQMVFYMLFLLDFDMFLLIHANLLMVKLYIFKFE